MTGEDIIIVIDEGIDETIVIPGDQFYRGPAGYTPYIPEGSTTWWINGVDTGKIAIGANGEPLRYEDLTPEQIAELQQPANEAAAIAIEAAGQVNDVIVIAEQTIDDAEQATINANNAATQLVDGAEADYNTLKKLQDKIKAVEAIIGDAAGDDDNLINTVRELLAVFSNFPEGSDMATLLTAKVNVSDIYNALDCIIEGKVLDARQGKVLSDAITSLTTTVGNKLNKPTITQSTLADNDTFVLRKVDGTVVEITKTELYAVLDDYFAKLSGGNAFIGVQSMLDGVKLAKILPGYDGETAIQLTKADGSSVVLNLNTTNNELSFYNNLGTVAFLMRAIKQNLIVGSNAGNRTMTGNNNSLLGLEAGKLLTSGEINVLVQGGGALTTGSYNTFIGNGAGGRTESGSGNVMIGINAGSAVAGTSKTNSNCVYIGANTSGVSNQNNQVVIGDSAVGKGANTVVIGNDSIVKTYLKGIIQLSALNIAPSSATDIGATGEIRITADYVYVCVATNQWKRTPLSTW